MAGRFFTFEGIDGSGKSTAISAVTKALEAEGHAVWQTREERDAWTGEAVRRAIEERAPPWTTAFLFMADRAAHMPEIEANLANGHVLCDRFVESTYAYQGATLGDDAVGRLRDAHSIWCRPADHVILLDLPADVALARAEARGETTAYEKADFLAKVRQNYLRLAALEPHRFTVIDAAQSPEAVAAQATSAVLAHA